MRCASNVISRPHPKFELAVIIMADLVMAIASVAIAGMTIVLVLTPG